jgi:hypothetical protein
MDVMKAELHVKWEHYEVVVLEFINVHKIEEGPK